MILQREQPASTRPQFQLRPRDEEIQLRVITAADDRLEQLDELVVGDG